MARTHSPSRLAARHTGRQYQSGYQFQPEREFTLELGPFYTIIHDPNLNNMPYGSDKNIIARASNIRLRDGVINSIGLVGSAATIVSSGTVLKAYNTVIDGTEWALVFYRDKTNSNYITVFRYNPSASGNHASTLVSADELVDAATWGDDVYFVHPGLGSVYTYNIAAGTFTTVAGSPANSSFIFELSNNLCTIAYDSTDDIWEVFWAVDSTPSDWSGVGSGSQTLAGKLGTIRGVGIYGSTAYIIGSTGATRMLPTGQASPAFSFEEVPAITGCSASFCVSSSPSGIYYADRESYLTFFAGGQPTKVRPSVLAGEGVKYSAVYDAIVSWHGSDYGNLIDHAEARVIGRIQSYSLDDVADTSGPRLLVVTDYSGAVTYNVYVPNSVGSTCSFKTPNYHFGLEVEILEIEIITTSEDGVFTANPTFTVTAYENSGASTTYTLTNSVVIIDSLLLYPTSIVCRAFYLSFEASVGVSRENGIRAIRLHCRTLSEDNVTRINI